MTIERYTDIEGLARAASYSSFQTFLEKEPNADFFQAPEFLDFIGPVQGYRPVLFLALDGGGKVVGSLLGVYQRDGGAVKSWLSRRMVVFGGPLGDVDASDALLQALVNDAAGQAIYVEFRNHFDTENQRVAFDRNGFTFRPHLNFLLDLEGEEVAMKKLSSNRRRQMRSSLAAGATYGEAESEQEVNELYRLLSTLYRNKVGKPLPALDLFKRFHTSPSARVFVVRYQGRVIGGSAGPVYRGRTSYQWYVCGDNSIKDVHSSVLATWAHIEDAARRGFTRFDFMGAGRPGQGYGVHEFKARFGGREVCHGRYEKVLNRTLYKVGVIGLKAYHRMGGLLGKRERSIA